MATLASALLDREDEVSARPTQPQLVAVSDPAAERVPVQRSIYQPSRRAGPVAFVASTAVILAGVAVMATLNIVAQHKASSRLTVVALKQLDTTPPPPPPQAQSLDQPTAQPPQVFVPKPMIALPSPGPTQVAIDAPPPPQPPVPVAAKIAVPVGPPAAAPVVSSDPVEGGDLSSQVLSAKPPVYPIDSRRRKEQGTVKLMVLVGPDGHVSDIAVANSSGSARLDQAALSAVKRWRWAPQKKSGVAVAVRGFVPVTFALG